MAIWTKYSAAMNTSKTSLKYRIALTLNSQDISANTSNVTVAIQAWRTNTGYTTSGTGTAYCTINGTNYSQATNNNQKITYNSYTQLFSQTVTIAHNTDGTKTLAMAASINIPTPNLTSSSQSASIALNTIPRYTSITAFSATVIERNRIDISWTAANTCNYWWYSLNGGSSWTAVGAINATSGSRAITGLSAGTAYSLRVRVRRSDSNLTTDSSTLSRTTTAIAAPNTPTLSSTTRVQAVMNWSSNRTVTGVQYRLGSGAWQTAITFTARTSGSFTITGLVPNTSYSVSTRVRDAIHGTWSGASGGGSITTLAIASPNAPTLRDRTCTSINVAWTSNRTVIRTQYSLNGGGWQNGYSANFAATTSGHFNITGLAPNTTYGIRIRVNDAAHTSSWSGASGTTNMATIRLTTAGAPTFNTGNSLTVALSRGSTSVSNDVTLQTLNNSGSWIDIAATTQRTDSVTFSLTEAQLNTIYNNRVNAKTTSSRLVITNRWGHGGTSQGTSYSSTGTCTIVNANPSIASVSYIDTNATIQGMLNDNQKILRGKSTLSVTAGQATSQKGATLKSYKVSIGGSEYTVNTSGTSEAGKIINVGTINQSSNQTATLTVIDSRGYTASRSFTVQVLDYVAPQFIFAEANRENNYEEPSYIDIQARRTIVKPSSSDVNQAEMRYRIKQNPNGEYGEYIDLNSELSNISGIYQSIKASQYIADYPSDNSYTIEVGIKDKFTNWDTRLVTLTEGIALMKYEQDKIAFGVPISLGPYTLGFNEDENTLDIVYDG